MSLLGTRLTSLVERVPVAHGRAGKEAAQIVAPPLEQVERLIEYRSGQGWFRRAIAMASGMDGQHADHINRGLARNQRVLRARLDELGQRGGMLDADVAKIAGHLRRTQSVVDDTVRASRETAAAVSELAEITALLADLVDSCESRLGELDADIAKLTTRTDLNDCYRLGQNALDAAYARWVDGQTYAAFPFPVQVSLLALEVAAGPCGQYELLSEKLDGPATHEYAPGRYFRNRLARKIKAAGGERLWVDRRPVVEVLAAAVEGVEVTDAEVASEILGARLHPDLATRHGGLVTAVSMVLDIAAERTVTDPDIVDALARAQAANGPTRVAFDGAGYVEEIVEAVARAELRERRKLAALRIPGASDER